MKIWDKNRTLSEREIKQAGFRGKNFKETNIDNPGMFKM
jgi:hypothetical protein